MTFYSIKIHNNTIGSSFTIENLNFKILESDNGLCPSNYNPEIRCFWEGDLHLKLIINDLYIIDINDHDKRNNKLSEINIRNKNYKFQGIKAEVQNMDKDSTYLIFSITN